MKFVNILFKRVSANQEASLQKNKNRHKIPDSQDQDLKSKQYFTEIDVDI